MAFSCTVCLISERRLSGEDRKWSTFDRIDADGPFRTHVRERTEALSLATSPLNARSHPTGPLWSSFTISIQLQRGENGRHRHQKAIDAARPWHVLRERDSIDPLLAGLKQQYQ